MMLHNIGLRTLKKSVLTTGKEANTLKGQKRQLKFHRLGEKLIFVVGVLTVLLLMPFVAGNWFASHANDVAK